MTAEPCAREPLILAALRAGDALAAGPSGLASGNDAAHLAECPACALAVDAERWLRAAAADLAPARLAAPGSLILRAQLRARREAAERSLRPLEIWRTTALMAGGFLVVSVSTGAFLDGLWARTSPAQALFAAGAVLLAALPIWLRSRRGTA